MGSKFTILGLSLLLSAAHADSGPGPLLPISSTAAGAVRRDGRPIAPKKDINLNWQTPKNETAVSINLSMQKSAVILENIDAVKAVHCTNQTSVAVTFHNTEAFHEALTQWRRLHDSFVMITNHLGECDEELERSFFIADSDTLAPNENTLTIIAQAEKSDLMSTASSTSIDFTSMATPGNSNKRGLHWTEKGLTMAYNFHVSPATTIVDNTFVNVILKDAQFKNSVKYSGRASWKLRKGVTEFYIDIEKSMFHHMEWDVKIKAPLNDSFSWAPPALEYSSIHIPGIIKLGPAAKVSIGASFSSAAFAELTGAFTTSMDNGKVHIDLRHWKSSYSRGWDTTHTANFNATANVSVSVRPVMDFSVGFDCEIFNNLVELNTGIKAEPAFPFVTTFNVKESASIGPGTKPHPDVSIDTGCPNGLNGKISFQFDLIAFATKWFDIVLYEYKHPIWSGCLWKSGRH